VQRTPEYDAFGPWTYRVRTEEEIPRLYRDHGVELESAHLVLKVPRAIDRREANPEMHLYDHLVVAGKETLTVLSRRGDSYQTVQLPYRQIAAVEHSVSMLDGRLVVHDVDGLQRGGVAAAIRYSAVSRGVMADLVDVLRTEGLAARDPAERPGREPLPSSRLRDLDDVDAGLVTMQREIAAQRPGVVLLGAHPRAIVERRTGVLRRWLDKHRPVTLHAALVCADAGTLEFLHRREWFTSHPRPAWSIAHTVLFTSAVTAVGSHEHPRYVGAYRVQIASGRSVVEVACPDGAESLSAIAGALAGVRAM
jgi:hypothetical protein